MVRAPTGPVFERVGHRVGLQTAGPAPAHGVPMGLPERSRGSQAAFEIDTHFLASERVPTESVFF